MQRLRRRSGWWSETSRARASAQQRPLRTEEADHMQREMEVKEANNANSQTRTTS